MFSRKQYIDLFWPAFIEQALTVSVGFVSTLVMAVVSKYAVSGVGLVESLNAVIASVLLAVGGGAAVIVSQKLGADDSRGASGSAGQAISMTVVFSTALAIVCLVLAKPIIYILFGGADNEVLDAAVAYFIFSAVSYPFLATSTTLSGIFRSARDSKTPMKSAIIANVINIVISILLVQVFRAGIYGAGIAMLTARVSTTVFLMWHITHKEFIVHIPKFTLRLDGKLLKEILRIAVPSGIDQFLFTGGKLVVAVFLKGFGTESITANALVNSAFSITNIPGGTMLTISMPVIGQQFGAKKFSDVRKTMVIMVLATVGVLLLGELIFLPFLGGFISMYNQSDVCNEIALKSIMLCLVLVPVFWPGSFVGAQMLRSTGDVFYTMVISVISMFTFRVAGSWFLGVYLGWGLLGIWSAMAIDWVVRTIFFLPRAFLCYWSKEYRTELRAKKTCGC